VTSGIDYQSNAVGHCLVIDTGIKVLLADLPTRILPESPVITEGVFENAALEPLALLRSAGGFCQQQTVPFYPNNAIISRSS